MISNRFFVPFGPFNGANNNYFYNCNCNTILIDCLCDVRVLPIRVLNCLVWLTVCKCDSCRWSAIVIERIAGGSQNELTDRLRYFHKPVHFVTVMAANFNHQRAEKRNWNLQRNHINSHITIYPWFNKVQVHRDDLFRNNRPDV